MSDVVTKAPDYMSTFSRFACSSFFCHFPLPLSRRAFFISFVSCILPAPFRSRTFLHFVPLISLDVRAIDSFEDGNPADMNGLPCKNTTVAHSLLRGKTTIGTMNKRDTIMPFSISFLFFSHSPNTFFHSYLSHIPLSLSRPLNLPPLQPCISQ